MPGPLPQNERRRRNAPTIPTTALPASGRSGPIPRAPKNYALGDAGAAWWRWAWRLPQAAAWSTGDLYVVARRASLEDDLRALSADGFGPIPEFAEEIAEYLEHVRLVVQRLKALAGGRLAVLREARELDTRLGLTPKGMADLRWTIVPDAPAEVKPAEPSADGVVVVPGRWRVGAG